MMSIYKKPTDIQALPIQMWECPKCRQTYRNVKDATRCCSKPD